MTLSVTDLNNGATDLKTLDTIVNSQTESTATTRYGSAVKTISAIIDDAETSITTAISGAGYSIVW